MNVKFTTYLHVDEDRDMAEFVASFADDLSDFVVEQGLGNESTGDPTTDVISTMIVVSPVEEDSIDIATWFQKLAEDAVLVVLPANDARFGGGGDGVEV